MQSNRNSRQHQNEIATTAAIPATSPGEILEGLLGSPPGVIKIEIPSGGVVVSTWEGSTVLGSLQVLPLMLSAHTITTWVSSSWYSCRVKVCTVSLTLNSVTLSPTVTMMTNLSIRCVGVGSAVHVIVSVVFGVIETILGAGGGAARNESMKLCMRVYKSC